MEKTLKEYLADANKEVKSYEVVEAAPLHLRYHISNQYISLLTEPFLKASFKF